MPEEAYEAAFSMVCEPALGVLRTGIELGRYMLLGKGEEATGGRNRDSITSDVDGGGDRRTVFGRRF